MYCTDGGSVRLLLDNKSDSVSIDRLRPFYKDETPRSATHETVNSSAADDVLPALVSRPRRNLVSDVWRLQHTV